MATLPVVRETPVQESVEIRNRGAYTIPEEARKAHRVLVDVEVISVTRTQYKNFMYNSPQGDYANVTLFNGASIKDTIKVKYPSQRLIDFVNIEGGICQMTALSCLAVSETVANLATAMGIVPVLGDNREINVWGLLISHLKIVCPEDTQVRITCQWYPFVHIPGVGDVNPDLDDPADGEPEYNEPRRNPVSDPWIGNPDGTARDPGRDPRDYDSNAPDPKWRVWLIGTYLNSQGQYAQQDSEPPLNQGAYEIDVDPSTLSLQQGSSPTKGPDDNPVYFYSLPGVVTFGGGWKPTPSLGYRRSN